MRESKIEKYLHKQVKLYGGTTRKWPLINEPDRIVFWPTSEFESPNIHFVETKAPRKKPRAAQEREHKRLRELGCLVYVLDTIEKVDAYIIAMRV